LTQESLAERAGISVESVSKIEQQERSPSLTMLRTLADALGVPVGKVVDSTGLYKQASEERAETGYRTSADNGELPALDFCVELTRLMAEHGVGVRELARRTSYDPSYISNIRSGRRLPSLKVAEKIDKALEANGKLAAAARSQEAGIILPRLDKRHTVPDSSNALPSGLTDLGEIEQLRQLVTDTLSQGGISDASLDEWGQIAIRYAKATRGRPAPLLLTDLGRDLAELNRTLARKHSASALRELASFRFHEGNAYTHLGDIQAALKAQERALELCPQDNYTDWAMTRLDRAQCLTYTGEVAEAVKYVGETITNLTAWQRRGIITLRAKQIVGALPEGARHLPAVRDLYEILMLADGREGDHYR